MIIVYITYLVIKNIIVLLGLWMFNATFNNSTIVSYHGSSFDSEPN